MEKPITVYEPRARSKKNIFQTLFIMAVTGYDKRDLIYQLFKRDFLMMYKKSFLGFGWHLVAPVLAMASWIFLNSSGVLQPGDTGVPYPAFVLVGITFWNFFSNLVKESLKTLSIGKGFITQVNFPHEVLFYKQALQQVVNFAISLGVVLLVLLILGVVPHWKAVFLPLLILPVFFLAGAIGLTFSVFEIASQDTGKMFELLLNFSLFITPIAYSLDKVTGVFRLILDYNPLTYLIGEMRNLFLFGEIMSPVNYGITVMGSLVVFVFALRFFFVSEEKIIEKIS